jgi:signal transduction histidine kinase/DNA-binding NtrC family response regulator
MSVEARVQSIRTAAKRILAVGASDALCDEFSATGHIVDRAPAQHRSASSLPSGTWDACVIDADRLRLAGYELVRQARATQPGLALLIAVGDDAEGFDAMLASGADEWFRPGDPTRPTADVLSRAVAARRALARNRTSAPSCRVLVLDWDPLEAPLVRGALDQGHFAVSRAGDSRSALAALRARPTHVLVTSPTASIDGVNVVEAALRYDPRLRIVVASGHADLENTAWAIGRGAEDYLLRPVGPAQALGAVTAAWAAHACTAPNGEVLERGLEVLVLESHPMQARLLEEMLSQESGFATTTVADLASARRCLTERTFDAILCRSDGARCEALGFLQELRSIDPNAAVLLVANRLGRDIVEQALRIGAQDVISGQRLGREALGPRVRHAVARNRYRLAHERFVRDLQTREASQREVVRQSVDGMLIVDASELVVFSNPAADRMFEEFGAPLLGQRFSSPPSGDGHHEIQIRGAAAPGVADMTEVPIDWNGAPARLISLRDITERRQAQELRDRLAHAERLAAIGQLAAGVTHEINNPAAYVVANLTSMLDLTEDLALQLPGADGQRKLGELRDMLRENLEGMARIRSIAGDLRTFARIGSNEVSMVDLNECVASACKIAKAEIRQRAHLVQELADLPRIPGSPGKLAQVMLNLLINAAQAIPEGDVDSHRITVRSGTTGDELWVQVEDTGRGIPVDARDKIFDPFFTTKPRSQGTGLGLALCADIVGQHQGSIRVVPLAGPGTCLEVRFPRDTALSPSAPPPALPSRIVPRPRQRTPLRLLLIDDEPLVLRSLRRMLGDHHVDLAQGGHEALLRLAQDRNYDLILCDLMMPDMDGTVLYAELERAMPDLLDRVVFCSGGAFTSRTQKFLEQSTRPLVEKPLTRETFDRLVADWCPERRLGVPDSAPASSSRQAAQG